MSHEREPDVLLREALAAEARTVTASPAFTARVIGAAQSLPDSVPTLVPSPGSGSFSTLNGSSGSSGQGSPGD